HSGKSGVYPRRIPNHAPPYQIAWAINDYTQANVGATTAGTQISVWSRNVAGEAAKATQGTAHLVAAFDWFEKTLGPYRFGNQYASVSAGWPAGAFGAMDHHPLVRIGASAIRS